MMLYTVYVCHSTDAVEAAIWI